MRQWSERAEPTLPQPCRLCNAEFLKREDWLAHVVAEHGGLQRYRNALFSLLSLQPYVVKGQEWRAIAANFSEFFARAALDWDNFTPQMNEMLWSPDGLSAEHRWTPRCLQACVFCTRRLWQEDLLEVFLAGPQCFMRRPDIVAEMLAWERYHEAWEHIPVAELKASAVWLRIGTTTQERLVLMHKRRVDDAQRRGEKAVFVCHDCYEAFSLKKPYLCRFALANHLWLGRWDPVFRDANLSHQMLLALARIVTTKVVLRPEGRVSSQSGGTSPAWDFLFHQSGMIGSAILFGNASCKKAMAQFPPQSLRGEFAVSFVGPLEPPPPQQHQTSCSDDALAGGLASCKVARDPVGQTRVFEDVDWRTALLHCLKGCPDSPATGESSGLCARLSGEARQRPCLGMYGTKNTCCMRA